MFCLQRPRAPHATCSDQLRKQCPMSIPTIVQQSAWVDLIYIHIDKPGLIRSALCISTWDYLLYLRRSARVDQILIPIL
jgi:hypothetical protein